MIQDQEKKELKLLPCGATKSQVFEMYPTESDKYLRTLMQSIQIENNPHIPESYAKKRQRLTRKELEKVIDVMGTPRGYENRFKN